MQLGCVSAVSSASSERPAGRIQRYLRYLPFVRYATLQTCIRTCQQIEFTIHVDTIPQVRYVVLHPWYADGDAICSGRRAGLWAVLAGDRWSLATV